MSIENEIKSIPSDVENIVKGDIKIGKARVPKIAVVGGVVGLVAFIALKSRGKGGSFIPSGLQSNTTSQLSEDGSTATIPNSSQSALDSLLGNTTPPDASGIPLPNIPLPDLGNISTDFPQLPSLPQITLPDFGSLPSTDFSLPSIPYMQPDSGYMSGYDLLGDRAYPNTGIVPPAYTNSAIQPPNPKKVVPQPTKQYKGGTSIPVGSTNTQSRVTGSKTPVKNTGIVPPKLQLPQLNTIPKAVNFFVNGVQQFTNAVKVIQQPKPISIPSSKPTTVVSKPPVTYNPITGSGYIPPVIIKQPAPSPVVYNPVTGYGTSYSYKPAPLPPPPVFTKQSSASAASKVTGKATKVTY